MKTRAGGPRLRAMLIDVVVPGLCGLRLSEWAGLLLRHRFAVAPKYALRALLITALSAANSLLAWRERHVYGAAVAAQRIRQPIFILGHPRSGTTMLHRLMATDTRFASPTFWQVFNPHTFLTTERVGRSLGWLLPKTRRADQVTMAIDAPAEDENAMAGSLCSYYLRHVFPRQSASYEQYLTFHDAPAEDVARWSQSITRFYQKLTLRYQGRPLLLKSPMHTGRIRLLLALFPDARFIHISRDPYEVFRSTRQLVAAASPSMRLQDPPERDIDRFVIQRYQRLFEAYFSEKQLIPQGQLAELRYEDLVCDPVGQVGQIYRALNLPDFAVAEPALRRYVDSLQGYRTSEHRAIPPELQQRIARDWRRSFDAWGYSL